MRTQHFPGVPRDSRVGFWLPGRKGARGSPHSLAMLKPRLQVAGLQARCVGPKDRADRSRSLWAARTAHSSASGEANAHGLRLQMTSRLNRGTPNHNTQTHHPNRSQGGSPSRTRTYDLAVNSRALYQLSYRGLEGEGYPGRRASQAPLGRFGGARIDLETGMGLDPGA